MSRKNLLYLLIFAVLWKAPAYAVTIFDFQISDVRGPVDYSDPTTFTYYNAYFSLPQGSAPDSVSADLDWFGNIQTYYGSDYYNVALKFDVVKNGVVLSQSSAIGTVHFWWDGVSIESGDIDPFIYDAQPPFDPLSAFNPTFLPGTYLDPTSPPNFYSVQAEVSTALAPEPSSLLMLATGVVGGLSMARRRFLSC
jgi:hypothetical protein